MIHLTDQHMVYKYKLSGTEYTQPVSITMPMDSQIVSVAEQDGDIFIWAVVDPNWQPWGIRKFRIVGTGDGVAGHYVGTVHSPSGFVWHIIEV